MAKQIRLEFISEGFKEILCSQGVKEVLEDKANEIAMRAQANLVGNGDVTTSSRVGGYGGGRHVAYVHCPAYEESENKALSKAVGK